MAGFSTVKTVLNGISRVQNIFLLKPGFRLIKIYYDSQRDLKIFQFKTKFRLIKGPFKTGFTVLALMKLWLVRPHLRRRKKEIKKTTIR
jgi:hypothetical protein